MPQHPGLWPGDSKTGRDSDMEMAQSITTTSCALTRRPEQPEAGPLQMAPLSICFVDLGEGVAASPWTTFESTGQS
jgi:hypothetical protein